MPIDVFDGKRHFGYLEPSVAELFIKFCQSLKINAANKGVALPAPDLISNINPGYAHINHNRWIVQCPDCPNAEMVWLQYPVMMCQNCWNSVIDHKWRAVIIPSQRHVHMIEDILKKRPLPQTRHWYPGETIKQLLSENAEHGIQ